MNLFTQSLGFGCGSIALDDFAMAIDQKLGEIPFNPFRTQHARGLLLEQFKQGMSIGAIDFQLGKQWEADTKIQFAEGLDLLLIALFLSTKLVTGKT